MSDGARLQRKVSLSLGRNIIEPLPQPPAVLLGTGEIMLD